MMTREFTRNDLKACAELFVNVFNRKPWNDQWSVPLAVDYFKDVAHSPGFNGFILEDEHTIDGFVLGTRKKWWSGDIYYLYEMCVTPSKQGKGIGSQLMDYTKQSLIEKGYTSIVLLTERIFPSAQFYEKQGFIESPHTRFYLCGL